MMKDVLNPGVVGIAGRRSPELPTLVITEEIATPVAHVKRRISEDVIRLQIRMTVIVERITMCDLTINSADGKVHPGQSPGCVVGLLSVDADIAESSPMCCHELLRLDEHAR